MKGPLHLPAAGVSITMFTSDLVPRDEVWGAVWDPALCCYRVAGKSAHPSAFVVHPGTAQALAESLARVADGGRGTV